VRARPLEVRIRQEQRPESGRRGLMLNYPRLGIRGPDAELPSVGDQRGRNAAQNSGGWSCSPDQERLREERSYMVVGQEPEQLLEKW